MQTDNRQSDALLARLHQLHPKHIDLSLDRIMRLLGLLDNPQNKLPPTIHIAGTNGKGSVLAFLKAILQAKGARIHAYTSPHLLNFHERIQLAGKPIDEAILTALLTEVIEKNGTQAITFFEAVTAAALAGFARHRADYLLLETGLGGRLDATNVIARPQLSILTPISLDHEHFLGDTLASIAAEKAGILKQGTMAIIARQDKTAQSVIEAHAQHIKAPLFIANRDWHAEQNKDRLLVKHRDGCMDLPLPRLAGAHQIENAGTAAIAAHMLGIDEKAIAQGIEQAHWRGRLERLPEGKLTDKTAATQIWLDGGHNPAAAKVLANWAQAQNQKQPRPLYLICGMLNSKQAVNWFNGFAPLQPIIHTIAIPDQANSLSADRLSACAKQAGLTAKPFVDITQALISIRDPQARILICGSLYLVAHVLRANGESLL